MSMHSYTCSSSSAMTMVHCYNTDVGIADLEELSDFFCVQLHSGQRKFEGCCLFASLLHITQRQGTVRGGPIQVRH